MNYDGHINTASKESFYMNLFKNNQAIMLLINQETFEIEDCNLSACNFYGYSYDEMLKLKITNFNILTKEQVEKELNLAKAERRNHFCFKHRLSSGQVRDVEVHSTPINLEGKELLFSIISDATKSKIYNNKLKVENALLERTVAERTYKLEETNAALKAEIEERESIEETLKHELAFSQALLENIPDGVVACNSEGILTLFNRTAREWHGMGAKKLTDDKWTKYYNLYTEDGSTPLNADEIPLSRAFKGEILKNAGMAICAKNQPIRYIHTNGCPFYDDKGKKLGAVTILSDITEQKQAEEALQMYKRQLADIIEFLPDATLAINQERRIVIWNKAIEKMTGIPAADIIGKGDYTYTIPFYGEARPLLMDLIFQDDEDRATQYFNLTREGDTLIAEVFCPALYNNKGAWIFIKASPLHDQSGNVIGMIESIRDITERKLAEDRLKESEERFRATFEQAAVGIVHATLDGKFIRVNQKFCDIVGYTQNELLDMSFMDITHHDDLQDDLGNMAKLLNGDINTFSIEKRYFKKDRTIVWVNLTVSVIDQLSEKHIYVMGVVEDITKRKSLETALSNDKKLLETTLISVGDGVISTDNQGNVIFLNRVAELLTGWKQEAARGKFIEEVFNIINGYTLEKCENIVKKVLESGKILELANHTILISKDGIELPIEDSAAPIIKENGEIDGVVLVFRDFSEKEKKLKEIEFLSYHDQLTGLYNRRFYEEELKRLDTQRNLPLTIIMGDVNGLKLVNDSFGHTIGDELLKKIAGVIKKGCRADDIIARLGGDEFVVILPKTDDFETEQIIKRINELSSKEKVGAIDISISFGFMTKNNKKEKIQEVFKKAEDSMYKKKLFESPSMRGKTISAIVSTLHEKNKREEQHSHRVSTLCKSMGEAIGLSEYKIEELKLVGLLHDIGKIAIDENILNKPGKLTDSEWKEIKRHPEIGYRILSTVNDMSEMAEYVLAHHEKWDGKGYPRGLKGEEIPFESRIISIADAYDAMTSERSYRNALPEKDVIEELHKNAGIQFDPKLVCVFIEKVWDKECE